MLELPPNTVDTPLLAQPRTGLPEAERDTRIDALSPQVEYPIEIAHTSSPDSPPHDTESIRPSAR